MLVRTTYVAQIQEFLNLMDDRNDLAEATIVCRDCKSASPVESLILVDTLHVQCPLCLYVFMDPSARTMV